MLRIAEEAGAPAATVRPVTDGGAGCADLADAVVSACDRVRRRGGATLEPLYRTEDDLRTKIARVAAMYGADGVDYALAAARFLDACEADGFGDLAVVVAKTPLSLSHDPSLKGVPTGWRLPVREVCLAAGAGYVYALCGTISTMTGLPSRPAGRAHRLRHGHGADPQPAVTSCSEKAVTVVVPASSVVVKTIWPPLVRSEVSDPSGEAEVPSAVASA